MKSISQNPSENPPEYSARTPEYYLQQIKATIHDPFTDEQTTAILTALDSAIPKPSPKIVDLRVTVDLILSRFYIVLFVGKDRRKKERSYRGMAFSKAANRVAAVVMLIGFNLTISLFIFLIAYLAKSSLGVNLFSEHLSDYIPH